MPEKVAVFVDGVPSSYGHFSQAIKYGDAIHISGQLPIDGKTNKLVSTEVDAQARKVFEHLTAVMQACGGALTNVLSITLYLVDLRDHAVVDKVSRDYFFFMPPARSVVAVAALPFGARLCIDAVAQLPSGELPGGGGGLRRI
ncbi:MAG: Rid family hydrolase [Candidatus Sumerlaeia bacterium]|nr:Rid family hydrolase [Candidatus Sumerlaeia bacterium]